MKNYNIPNLKVELKITNQKAPLLFTEQASVTGFTGKRRFILYEIIIFFAADFFEIRHRDICTATFTTASYIQYTEVSVAQWQPVRSRIAQITAIYLSVPLLRL